MGRTLSINDDPLAFLDRDKKTIEGDKTIELPVDDIVVEEQVRKEFGEEGIKSLAESIKQVGLINPPVVRKKNGTYVMLDGERRLRACKLLGIDRVLCSIKQIDEEDVHGAQIIANMHRQDLTLVELYYGLKLYQDKGLSIRDIAAKTGTKKAQVEEILKARKFEEKLKDLPAGEEGNKEFRKLAAAEGISDPEAKASVKSNTGSYSRSDINKLKKSSKPSKHKKNKAEKGVSEFRTDKDGIENSNLSDAKKADMLNALYLGDESSATENGYAPMTSGDLEAKERISKLLEALNKKYVATKFRLVESSDGTHIDIKITEYVLVEPMLEILVRLKDSLSKKDTNFGQQ